MSFHYSTCLSFILSISYHYSTFPHHFTFQLTFLPYFRYHFTIQPTLCCSCPPVTIDDRCKDAIKTTNNLAVFRSVSSIYLI
jgi:hypothetical protein